MDGWMDGSKSWFKELLSLVKNLNVKNENVECLKENVEHPKWKC
jgi:hypothetical protein